MMHFDANDDSRHSPAGQTTVLIPSKYLTLTPTVAIWVQL